MMKRPADQAKLLFLYFLRYSSAAFASEPIKSSGSSLSKNASPTIILPSSTSSSPTSTILDGHISLRTARRADIPSIQRCNLATLPENYNSNFYMHHIRTWPELALVMEHVPKNYENRHANRRPSNNSCYYDDSPPLEVVGYVLGKVEQRPRAGIPPRPMLPRSKVHPDDDHDGFRARDYSTLSSGPWRSREMLGHVTSLAILDSYRRRGLANQLMDQLHYHMRERYEADAVGLHVRVSNVAATKLYVETMGYTVADIIKGYYQDGEDAYLMRKEFELEEEVVGNGGVNGSLEARSRSGGRRWFSGLGGGRGRDEWRPVKGMELPRKIPLLTRRKDEQQPVGDVLQDVSRVRVNSRQDGGERRVVVRGQQQLFSH